MSRIEFLLYENPTKTTPYTGGNKRSFVKDENNGKKKKKKKKRKGLTKHRKRRERNEDLDIWKIEPHNWGQSHEKKKKKDDGLIMLEDQEEDP